MKIAFEIRRPKITGLVILLCMALLFANQANAQITVTGSLNRAYDGSDPWILNDSLTVGFEGEGSLKIENGSAVSFQSQVIAKRRLIVGGGNRGEVTVTGPDSFIDTSGLFVATGSKLVVTDFATVFSENTSFQGETIIRGNSLLNASSFGDKLTVTGEEALVSIEDHSRLMADTYLIDDFGSVYVGSNSRLETTPGTGDFRVQHGGTLWVDSGAQAILSRGLNVLATRQTFLGEFVGGSVLVSGTGSKLDTQYFGIVMSGSSLLDISDGGEVSSDGEMQIYGEHWGGRPTTVTVDGSNSELFVPSNNINVGGQGAAILDISNGGQVATLAGDVNIRDGGIVRVGSGGTLRANDVFQSSGGSLFVLDGGIIDANYQQDGGTLSPGNSPGTATFLQDLFINSGNLEIEIGGLLQGTDYDFVSVGGNAVLGGELDISFLSGFENQITEFDSFTILTANSLSGSFAGLDEGATIYTTDGRGSFTINYTGNSVQLSSFAVVSVPEPAAGMLLGMLAVSLISRRRRNTLKKID